MKLNIKLCLLHVAGGSSMMKALKNVVTFFLLLAKQGSSEIAASITKSLTHSNRRDQQTCQSGFTFNTCANCCGYKFASKSDLSNAIGQYFYDKLAGKNSSDMNCWDVSSIHDMSTLFFEFNGRYSNAVYFDEPIGCWDVSSVTTMWSMFAYTHFNQSIGNWDVSKVTDMSGMFYGATKFNQDIGNWDVSKVVNMNGMFYQASSFNQTISNWNVSRVTNMHQMFLLATSFNQAVSNWNVSKVANMYQMFYYATNFNQDLCAWYNKLLSTTVVGSMFLGSGCTNKTAPDFLVMKSFCQACTCNETSNICSNCDNSCGSNNECFGSCSTCSSSGKCVSSKSAKGGVQGDPHFKTWHGDHFSYHGECDLVLLKNDHFSDGLGILVHIRTKIEKTWSYVKNVAIKIGHDILEIEGQGQVWNKRANAVHSINRKINAELPFLLGTKFPVTRLKEKQCDTHGAKCIEAIVYKIVLGDGDNILITQKWGVIKVGVTVKDGNKFHNTVGIMGHLNKAGFLARNGIHKMRDINQFGQEWQVLQSEPMIFKERRAPQHPEQCTLPSITTKRRLGEEIALYQMAVEACAGVEEASRDFCIFDVTAVGTEEAASTYYTAYDG